MVTARRAQKCDVAWRDGALVTPGADDSDADDSTTAAATSGASCYSTTRWDGRAPRFAAQVVARLRRDAHALGFRAPATSACDAALRTLGFAAFGAREGVLRLSARAHTLLCTARPLPAPRAALRVCASPVTHAGPAAVPGAKIPRPEITRARKLRDQSALDEVLLFDASGHLVEGSVSNVVVHCAGGVWATPPQARGAVRGVALALVRERVRRVVERDCGRGALRGAREIVVVNAVHGGRGVAWYEGREVGGARELLAVVEDVLGDF